MEYQLSMFDAEPSSWIERDLLRGSGFAGGKIRIYAAAINMTEKQLASYLKEEYGIGGHSSEGGFADYNSAGYELKNFTTQERQQYTWQEIAKKVKMLLAIDKYLTPEEKEQIKEIQNRHHKTIPVPVPRMKYT